MSVEDQKSSALSYDDGASGGFPTGELLVDDQRRHSTSYFEISRGQGQGDKSGAPGTGYDSSSFPLPMAIDTTGPYHRSPHVQPLTQQHTGPAFFNMHRAESPGFGSSLMPSYGSAPSLSHMNAFANMNLSGQQNQGQGGVGASYETGQGGGFDPASMPAGGNALNVSVNNGGYHPYGDQQASRHMRARALSSPGPGSTGSQPGSVSPVFSAADISPTNSVYSSRAPPSLSYTSSTDQAQSTVTPTHLALGPSMAGSSSVGAAVYPPPIGGPGPGLGMIGGHPYVIGGARYPPGAIPRTMARREGEVGGERREDTGAPDAILDPMRRREDVRLDARRARIESEQRRRDELREGFKRLKETLPQSAQRASKSSLLDRAITHIGQIESANQYLHQSNRRLLAENEQLRDTNHKLVASQTQSMTYGRDPSDASAPGDSTLVR